MYAVLDIEATGGQMGEEEIIEIAVYRFDGQKVTDQLISLVKPERQIDAYVQKLTQITPKMVRTAPGFHEIAKRVIEITKDAILVGHNVDFDYRMLRQEFRKLGYIYQRETIDTVILSEKYFPDTASHSLGKLCKELGIPTTDRHRASGDARATIELFKLLLEKDVEKNISKTGIGFNNRKSLAEFGYKGLPNSAGLFYIFDSKKRVVYLSAAENIAQTARRVLNGKSDLSRKIKNSFDSIQYEITGNEMISKIKELNEIKKLKPKFNPPDIGFTHSICKENRSGYDVLMIRKNERGCTEPLIEFQNSRTVRDVLSHITTEFKLCPVLNRLSPPGKPCFSHEVGECLGACEGEEPAESYNRRVDQFLEKINLKNKNFLMIGNGRTLNEKSFVRIDNGVCKGYGYFEFHNQIKDSKTISERMTKLAKNPDFVKIIMPNLAIGRYRELISLDSQ